MCIALDMSTANAEIFETDSYTFPQAGLAPPMQTTSSPMGHSSMTSQHHPVFFSIFLVVLFSLPEKNDKPGK
jgi:hypothetical protein